MQSVTNGIPWGLTITVSIDLFLFSFDVHITMEKRIEGSESNAEQDTTAFGQRGGMFHLVSFLEPSPATPPQAWACFERKQTPAVRTTFDFDPAKPSAGVKSWNALYWSQFTFDD